MNKQNHIRSLVEEWLKSGNDVVSDAIKNYFHEHCRINPRCGTILERYVDIALNIHLHFSVGFEQFGALNSDNLCIIVQCAAESSDSPDTQHSPIDSCNFGVMHDAAGKGQRSVFVDVYQFVEHPEGGVAKLPNLIRLQTLDECLSLRGHPEQSSAFYSLSEIPRTLTDREHAPIINGLSINENKLPDEVIEGSADVMQTVTNNDAQFEWRVGKARDNRDDIRVNIFFLNGSALCFTVFSNTLYDCQMFFCPDEFRSNSVERVHDVSAHSLGQQPK